MGYGIGNLLVKPIANAAGKLVTGGKNPKFNPDLLKHTEIKGQLGITKEMLPSEIPGEIGKVSGSSSSEYADFEAQKIIDKVKQ